ncbi:MAG TPA: glycosyltransferase family 1 protein [Candidatus Sulfotelmatobacter sp.]|nr:glycosyltransferase family 1 protein [Candidatus Sulfotelmatobacter sp.]
MHLFINSLAASAGGGLTYIRNVIPHLATTPNLRVTVALGPRLREEFLGVANVNFVELEAPVTPRFWYEQWTLPGLLRRQRADVLLSTGNFALRDSPVPQILLSRNSIYTSADFYRDLRRRHEYRAWLDTRLRAVLAKRSIHWADATVAPSESFAAELCRWTGARVQAIHHGFDRAAFTRDSSPLAAEAEEKLRATGSSLKLLFVSHYNYYRNFETLFRALPLLRERLTGRSVKLLLTCKLAAGENPGRYRPEAAAKLVQELGVSDMVVELGTIPYDRLHQLYRRADLYVTPAYTETFAHPLVEAMASGVPVVASDLPVHHEICGGAALYFPRFSPQELVNVIVSVISSAQAAARLSALGLERSGAFSWKKHSDELLLLAHSMIRSGDETRRVG